MKKPVWKLRRFLDVVSVLGSVASITGISLIMFRDKLPSSAIVFQVVAVAFTTSVVLGMTSVAVYVMQDMASGFSPRWRLTLWAIMGPVCLLIVIMLTKMLYLFMRMFVEGTFNPF